VILPPLLGPLLAAGLATLPPLPPQGAPAQGSCQECHASLSGALAAPARTFARDVHARRGLGCVACHGGDATAASATAAMDPAAGFVRLPAREEIPALCGGCHANGRFVRRFAPNLPTDQLAQYRTSQHARALERGNREAAVCTSCHGAHGIHSVSDASSPVYAARVVETCARCHAREGERDPVSDYRRSVHWEAVSERENLSAPTCDDCHGSHGATPPGVDFVSNVCGQCHPRNMDLYRASPHDAAFGPAGIGACEGCHGNHAIARPSDAWVALDGPGVCGECHAAEGRPADAARAMASALARATARLAEAGERVRAARARGMLMVDAQVQLQEAQQHVIQARTLVHTVEPSRVEEETSAAVGAAERALELAGAAFEEIRYRRAGLAVAAVLIAAAFVLVLAKIRQLNRRREQAGARE
jgi:predicted CXXCH cytochrome family protein